MLSVENLRAAYGESEVLHGIDLTVKPAEIVAIMGRNGMGKTTLMKTLMGIVAEKSGEIRVGSDPVTGTKPHQRVAAGIAYVPQGRMIFSSMTVQENIQTGLTVTGSGTSSAKLSTCSDTTMVSPFTSRILRKVRAISRIIEG